jgi:hypothetical protein
MDLHYEAFLSATWTVKTGHSIFFQETHQPRLARREFPDAVHVAGVGLQGRLNNNRMERYHGTLKERTKVMRALKTTDTSVLDGQRIYYNHIRPHQGLNGKTPAEVAGLDLNLGKNKWESLIKKASRNISH